MTNRVSAHWTLCCTCGEFDFWSLCFIFHYLQKLPWRTCKLPYLARASRRNGVPLLVFSCFCVTDLLELTKLGSCDTSLKRFSEQCTFTKILWNFMNLWLQTTVSVGSSALLWKHLLVRRSRPRIFSHQSVTSKQCLPPEPTLFFSHWSLTSNTVFYRPTHGHLQTFFQRGATSAFPLSFSGCYGCNADGCSCTVID